MKIELNDWEDVKEFIALMNPAYLRAWNPHLGPSVIAERERDPVFVRQNVIVSPEAAQAAGLVEPDGLPTDIPAPLAAAMDAAVAETSAGLRQEAEAIGQFDADGVPHSTDWHSDPPKINADGRWKARRGRDNDAYKAWLLEQAVQVAEAAVAADAEPVATETHALPQDEQQAGLEEMKLVHDEMVPVATPTVDLAALVEASRVSADGYSADFKETLETAKVFSAKYGHTKFNELKSAVAPIDGNPFGKALQLFGPEERQLLRACIENYPKP